MENVLHARRFDFLTINSRQLMPYKHQGAALQVDYFRFTWGAHITRYAHITRFDHVGYILQ